MSAYQVDGYGDDKYQKKSLGKNSSRARENTQNKKKTDKEFNIWQNNGGGVDHDGGKKSVTVNDFGKRPGVDDFMDAGVNKNTAQADAGDKFDKGI